MWIRVWRWWWPRCWGRAKGTKRSDTKCDLNFWHVHVYQKTKFNCSTKLSCLIKITFTNTSVYIIFLIYNKGVFTINNEYDQTFWLHRSKFHVSFIMFFFLVYNFENSWLQISMEIYRKFPGNFQPLLQPYAQHYFKSTFNKQSGFQNAAHCKT